MILSKEREKLTYFNEINFRGNVPLEVTKIIGFTHLEINIQNFIILAIEFKI